MSWLYRSLAAILAVGTFAAVRAEERENKPAPASPAEAALLDKAIMTEAKEHSEIMANLTYLCDTIGPRLTGSAGLKRANDWTAEKLKSYGLENVHLEPYEIPAAWERGVACGKVVEPDNGRHLMLAAMGWTGSTNGKIVGDVVILKSQRLADLAPFKGKLKGAIVMRGEPRPIAPITDLSYGPGGAPRRPATPPAAEPKKDDKPAEPKKDAPPAEAKKDDKPAAQPPVPPTNPGEQARTMMRDLGEFYKTEGVAAVLIDSGKPHSLLVTTGSWRGQDRPGATEPLPSLFIAQEHYRMLYRLASRPAPAKTRVELEVSNKIIPGPVTVYNTVGEIKGSEKPDEFVVVGAHLDSWDLAQGATDNGTGSSVVLEVARLLAKSGVRPKRTIRFVLFSGEEQGLHGSKAYVTRHKDEMPKTSMAFVHDTGTGKVIGMGLQGREVLKPIFEKELVSLKDVGFKDISLRGMGGTDHLSFETAGVPGFACMQDMAEYRLTHHTQSDTLDKAKPDELIQGAQVMAVTAMRVANLPELLPRDKPKR